jgi:hypothetical protein
MGDQKSDYPSRSKPDLNDPLAASASFASQYLEIIFCLQIPHSPRPNQGLTPRLRGATGFSACLRVSVVGFDLVKNKVAAGFQLQGCCFHLMQ